ncbi:hypothetical protein ACI79N_24440 [Geodermatophilus sp. SYSU D00805]
MALSVVLVRILPLERLLNSGVPLADTPGSPVAAAVEGLVAATAVGAPAGLLPAVIAVRARVIDAIRFWRRTPSSSPLASSARGPAAGPFQVVTGTRGAGGGGPPAPGRRPRPAAPRPPRSGAGW